MKAQQLTAAHFGDTITFASSPNQTITDVLIGVQHDTRARGIDGFPIPSGLSETGKVHTTLWLRRVKRSGLLGGDFGITVAGDTEISTDDNVFEGLATKLADAYEAATLPPIPPLTPELASHSAPILEMPAPPTLEAPDFSEAMAGVLEYQPDRTLAIFALATAGIALAVAVAALVVVAL